MKNKVIIVNNNNNNKNIGSKLACRVSNHRFSRLYRLTRLEVEGAAN